MLEKFGSGIGKYLAGVGDKNRELAEELIEDHISLPKMVRMAETRIMGKCLGNITRVLHRWILYDRHPRVRIISIRNRVSNHGMPKFRHS